MGILNKEVVGMGPSTQLTYYLWSMLFFDGMKFSEFFENHDLHVGPFKRRMELDATIP